MYTKAFLMRDGTRCPIDTIQKIKSEIVLIEKKEDINNISKKIIEKMDTLGIRIDYNFWLSSIGFAPHEILIISCAELFSDHRGDK